MDPETVSGFLESWGYAALLVLLILNGVGSPVPEDLVLLTAGYLVYTGVFDWPLALTVSAAGVVVSDLMLYAAGRHLAWYSAGSADDALLSPRRLQRATRWFARLGDGVIFAARLIPGTRAVVFLTAGAQGIPAARFLRYDVPGAVLWVPGMLVLGHACGAAIGDLSEALEWLGRSALWAMAAAGLLLVLRLSWGREASKL
jgi:membrane protein DedA with SNARE-associated domain